jgi:malonyl-CoA/methylmalonyl-CoA synthetase
MYTRLLQGYDSMDPDQQSASSHAAKQLRLMVSSSCLLKTVSQFGCIFLTLF